MCPELYQNGRSGLQRRLPPPCVRGRATGVVMSLRCGSFVRVTKPQYQAGVVDSRLVLSSTLRWSRADHRLHAEREGAPRRGPRAGMIEPRLGTSRLGNLDAG